MSFCNLGFFNLAFMRTQSGNPALLSPDEKMTAISAVFLQHRNS